MKRSLTSTFVLAGFGISLLVACSDDPPPPAPIRHAPAPEPKAREPEPDPCPPAEQERIRSDCAALLTERMAESIPDDTRTEQRQAVYATVVETLSEGLSLTLPRSDAQGRVSHGYRLKFTSRCKPELCIKANPNYEREEHLSSYANTWASMVALAVQELIDSEGEFTWRNTLLGWYNWFDDTRPIRSTARALLADEVRFSVAMRHLADKTKALKEKLPENWVTKVSSGLSEAMSTAINLDYDAVLKAIRASEAYDVEYKKWVLECRDEEWNFLPACDSDCVGEDCKYGVWLAREPEPGTDTHVNGEPYNQSYYRRVGGWIMRRYLDGEADEKSTGPDRVTLMMVWGAIVGDEADIPDSGGWAAATLARLKGKTTLKMAAYYKKALGEIVARRGNSGLGADLDPDTVMRDFEARDKKK
ncbi:MAG: hypothetical protein ABIH21_04770 [Patescibacteria group bacterium]